MRRQRRKVAWLCGHKLQHSSTAVFEGVETTKPAVPVEGDGGFLERIESQLMVRMQSEPFTMSADLMPEIKLFNYR
jgi:hypothetical protein